MCDLYDGQEHVDRLFVLDIWLTDRPNSRPRLWIEQMDSYECAEVNTAGGR